MPKVTHGHSLGGKVSPEYRAWKAARHRCTNPDAANAAYYQARGIGFSPSWDSFTQFLEDVGPRPEGMTLDRIDTNGNYEPGNVRWTSRTTQQRNRRNNVVLEFNGESKCVAAWAETLGIPKETLTSRLVRDWTVEEAFTTPIRPKRASATRPEATSPMAS
jgi:hypothetical protein